VAFGGYMMEPDGWQLDSASAAALVVRTVDDIDGRSDEQRDALLAALLCAAWPGPQAQDQ
jgi:hypothetical protein